MGNNLYEEIGTNTAMAGQPIIRIRRHSVIQYMKIVQPYIFFGGAK